jgi:hypothetical protein
MSQSTVPLKAPAVLDLPDVREAHQRLALQHHIPTRHNRQNRFVNPAHNIEEMLADCMPLGAI